MRILISNPDTIGDVVLREPLFRALAGAGHELALVVQPLAQPVARLVAPAARLIELPIGVYHGELDASDEVLDPVAEAAQEFDPDVFIAAPYTWTVLEERLAAELSEARRIGQAGGKFVDPSFGPSSDSKPPFDEIVRVNEDLHELRKNEALARAVLGDAVHLGEPKLELTQEHRDSADATLAGLGLERGGYLAALVGHHQHTAVRNWRPERWVDALAHWMSRYERPVLLMGAQMEAEVSREIADALEAKGLEPRHWFGGPEGDTLMMAAMIEASRGYVGRDTGPMHVAAALGKPVLAVFGGGTWPRFRPAVSPSVSVTLAVPCSPCDWRCEQRRSHCVKDVPLGEVTKQIDRLESGAVTGAEVVQVEPSRAMLVGLAGDAARAARQYRVELSAMRRTLVDKEEQARRNAMSESAVLQRLDKLEQSLQQSSQASQRQAQEAQEAQRRASEVTQKLTQNTQALEQARKELAQAVSRAQNADQARAGLREELGSLRAQLAEAEERSARHEAEAKELRQQRDLAEQDAAALRAKYGGVDLKKLHENLGAARQLVGVLQGEKSDLSLRAERLLQERRTVQKLADQRQATIQALEHKLGELLASRWRQMGQRMRMAMVLPWEEAERRRLLGETANGQHASRS